MVISRSSISIRNKMQRAIARFYSNSLVVTTFIVLGSMFTNDLAASTFSADEIVERPSRKYINYPFPRAGYTSHHTYGLDYMGGDSLINSCSIGSVWRGDRNRECKRNNQLRIAAGFCNSRDKALSRENNKYEIGTYATRKYLSWEVKEGSIFNHGRWVEKTTGGAPFKNIVCMESAIDVYGKTTEIVNPAMDSSPIDVCAAAGAWRPIWVRCNTEHKRWILNKICEEYGYLRAVEDQPFYSYENSQNQLTMLLNVDTKKWELKRGGTRNIRKVMCEGWKNPYRK